MNTNTQIMMRCDVHSQLSMTYPFAIMMQLKSLEVTTTDILQLSLKKVKISRI